MVDSKVSGRSAELLGECLERPEACYVDPSVPSVRWKSYLGGNKCLGSTTTPVREGKELYAHCFVPGSRWGRELSGPAAVPGKNQSNSSTASPSGDEVPENLTRLLVLCRQVQLPLLKLLYKIS